MTDFKGYQPFTVNLRLTLHGRYVKFLFMCSGFGTTMI